MKLIKKYSDPNTPILPKLNTMQLQIEQNMKRIADLKKLIVTDGINTYVPYGVYYPDIYNNYQNVNEQGIPENPLLITNNVDLGNGEQGVLSREAVPIGNINDVYVVLDANGKVKGTTTIPDISKYTVVWKDNEIGPVRLHESLEKVPNGDTFVYLNTKTDLNGNVSELEPLPERVDPADNALNYAMAGIPAVGRYLLTRSTLPVLEEIVLTPEQLKYIWGNAAKQFITSTIGGEMLNAASLFGGYDNFGHLLYSATGGKDWNNESIWTKLLYNFPNPGYWIQPTTATVGTATRVAEDALNNASQYLLTKYNRPPIYKTLMSIFNDYGSKIFNINPELITYSIKSTPAIRNFMIANMMNKSLSLSPSSYKNIPLDWMNSYYLPNVRYKVGDLELNNPNLYYRMGDNNIGNDFLQTGIVRVKNSEYPHPMFSEGSPFYKSRILQMLEGNFSNRGNSFTSESSDISKSNLKGKLIRLLLKDKDKNPYTDMLISDKNNAEMIPANSSALPSSYGNLSRRIPISELNMSNTKLYRFEPGYGYRQIFPKTEEAPTYDLLKITPVDENGNLTITVDDLFAMIQEKIPYAVDPKSLINKGYNGKTDLILHIKDVVKSALEYPLPKGVTRQEFVTAALLHDIGKTITSNKSHGLSSNYLADLLNLNIDSRVQLSIANHMNDLLYFFGDNVDELTKALHAADVGRGIPYEELIEKYPYLEY